MHSIQDNPFSSNDRAAILHAIAQVIYDKKGKNIIAFDLRSMTSLFDYCLIAEGHVDKHTQAISYAIKDALKEKGEIPLCIDGQLDGEWVAMDYGDIVVHLFEPGTREKYQLERLWQQVPLIELHIDTTQLKGDSALYPVPE